MREVLSHYEEVQKAMGISANCHFAITTIKSSLAAAEKAAAEHDTVAMLSCYQDLKGIE